MIFDYIGALLDPCTRMRGDIRQTITAELETCLYAINERALDRLTGMVGSGQRIFFYANRQERMILSCYAMRVFHMGKTVFMDGEVPACEMREGDVLVVSCGTGDDPFVLLAIGLAKRGGCACRRPFPGSHDAC
jgi:6-phospho-3-hexuloisomerase